MAKAVILVFAHYFLVFGLFVFEAAKVQYPMKDDAVQLIYISGVVQPCILLYTVHADVNFAIDCILRFC